MDVLSIDSARMTQLNAAQGFVMPVWHMHQPPLVSPGTVEMIEPYVRFNAMRAYWDMPNWVEEAGIKATFNLTPSLMEQLELYTKGGTDKFLEHTRVPAVDLTNSQKGFILNNFFKHDHRNSIFPYPRYTELFKKNSADFSESDFRDLQVWHNLAMFGFGLRSKNSEVQAFIQKGRDFSEDDKKRIIEIQMEVISRVLDKYRRLQEKGKISVILSPYVHPILSLLIDQRLALYGMPGANLPHFSDPDDARAQLQIGGRIYERVFGRPPLGMWPSEGSVCMEMLPLIQQEIPSIKYLFTDAGIRERSCPQYDWWQKFVPWQVGDHHFFFRDRGISDDIGFVRMQRYKKTAYEIDKNIRKTISDMCALGGKVKPVVPIVLDGENLQPSRAKDAFDFIQLLYSYFAKDEKVISILPEEYLALYPQSLRLEWLFPGSWIASNFSTWTGDLDHSPGYKRIHIAEYYLSKLKQRIELLYPPSARAAALEEIYALATKGNLFLSHSNLFPLAKAMWFVLQAESSCFRWWFGGTQGEAADLGAFDWQFRALIARAYSELGQRIPDDLKRSLYPDRDWATSLPDII